MSQAVETRSQRRRAQTRGRLLEAAGELFAEKGVGDTRISDITERADVGAGSFYNHFEDKNALVQALLAELAESHGKQVDVRSAEFEDPAEVVAFAHCHFVKLAMEEPTFGQLMLQLNASHGLVREILGPRALRDIQAGVAAGRFEIDDPLAASFVTGGMMLGTISGVVEGILDDSVVEFHIISVLRILGLPTADSERIALAASRHERVPSS